VAWAMDDSGEQGTFLVNGSFVPQTRPMSVLEYSAIYVH